MYTKGLIFFKRSSFLFFVWGQKKLEKAEGIRYTVFEHSNTPVLLEAGCRLILTCVGVSRSFIKLDKLLHIFTFYLVSRFDKNKGLLLYVVLAFHLLYTI